MFGGATAHGRSDPPAGVPQLLLRQQTADAIHLAAAVHWGCDALLTNDRAFQLSQAPIEVL
jgi:predicted nucleic acid-binding protein